MHATSQLDREIVEFTGPDNSKLTGVLWLPPPSVPRKKVLFVLSHGGLSHKTGAHRAQYNLASYFASRGYTVFRFDPLGLGDSDGTVPSAIRQDLFGSIASGLFKESHLAAFRYLSTKFADYDWVLSGVCGGAISCLLAGVDSPHPIAAYALISCSVVLDGSRFDYSRREPTQTALKYLRLYVPKLTNPKAIWRFVTLQSDYRIMWEYSRSVVLRSKDKLAVKLGMKPKVSIPESGATGTSKPPVGLNPSFVKAASEAMRSSKVLFVYGDNDGFLWEFNDLYAAAHLSKSQHERILRVVPQANHMFIWQEWQQQAFNLIETWLESDVLRATGN